MLLKNLSLFCPKSITLCRLLGFNASKFVILLFAKSLIMRKKNRYAESFLFCWILLATNRIITGQLLEKYVGCFVENGNNQIAETVLDRQTNLTIEICIQKCYIETDQTQSEMTFAALTNGRRCTCRNNSGQQLPDQKCNVKCTGNSVQKCGGSSSDKFYSLYTVCPIGYFGSNCNQSCHCTRRLPCDRKTGICPDGCDDEWNGTSCDMISDTQKQYIGCYGDGPSSRRAMDVLNPGGKTGVTNQQSNSNEFCIDICSSYSYTYAGMQYGYDCYCGEKYDRYGKKTHRGEVVNCRDPRFSCPANRNQKCGGNYAISVYYVCPVGFYGRSCVNQCHCSDEGPCRFNGSCLNSVLSSCQPGWTGSTCTIRDCRINNGDCESDEKCETVDLSFGNVSACRCKDGFYRDSYTCRPTSLHYVGCYMGSTTQYTAVNLTTGDMLTIEFCILKCRQLNWTYSIIQGGEACLCGNEYGQISPDSDCQVPCIGNHLQDCGGKNATDGMSIYAVYTAKSFFRQYIGCFGDTKDPAIEKKFSWSLAKNNTIESCIRHCAFLNYTYAGLQYQYDCFCGNTYDRYGSLHESRCFMPCEGNSNQTCGGNYANSVYAVNNIFGCSSDTDCKLNEACNIIDLKYTNVSRCRCQQGFHRMNSWVYCTDVDECKSDNSTCNQTTENCVNSVGSYRCECKDGFVNISGRCDDIDECRNEFLSCDRETELCSNTIGSYICYCKPGYEYTIFGNCTDVDECQAGTSSCNTTLEHCFNTVGSYGCVCKDGFKKMFGKCEDMDECRDASFVCDTETELCENTIGSYACMCKPGYEKLAFGNCTDVDECQLSISSSPCDAFSHYCINSIGSYICPCREGFTNISGKCEEFNNTPTTGIIFGTLLAISLMIHAVFIFFRIKSAKPITQVKGMKESDAKPSSVKTPNQPELIYDEIPNAAGHHSVYEPIIMEKRQIVQSANSEYAALEHDDYLNIESST